MSTYGYADLTWKDVEQLDPSKAILLLPVGSIEQHGPHLPLDTDTITSLFLAEKLREINKRSELLIAPPLRYTYAKPSTVFPGTISIGGGTLIRLAHDLLRSFIAQNLKRIMIINAHMENTDFLIEGIALALEKAPPAKIILANWWELVSEGDMKLIFGQDWKGWVDEHAALVETSLMMFIAPELVREAEIVDDTRKSQLEFRVFPWDIANYPPSGAFSRTSGASRERGKRLIKLVLNELNRLIEVQFDETKGKNRQ